MRPGTRLLCDEPLVLGRTPQTNRRSSPQVAYFYAASLAQFCAALDTCAGEPRTWPRTTPTRRVYPRVCGGTGSQTVPLTVILGLSPRVRGNPPEFDPGLGKSGSIPACAGEPFIRHRIAGLIQVYPRVCGGNSENGHLSGMRQGLSPRVRGNQSGGVSPR